MMLPRIRTCFSRTRLRFLSALTVASLVSWLIISGFPSAPPARLPSQLIDYNRAQIKYISSEVIDFLYEHTDKENVDWTRLAYVLYATSETHLCNTVVLFEQLRYYETKAQLVLLISDDVEISTQMASVIERNKVTVKRVQRESSPNSESYWASSLTKMSVFGVVEYDRLIYIDSDSYLPHGHMDELFFIPPVELACVPAYWLVKDRFGDAWWDTLLRMKSGPGNWEPPRPMTHQEKELYAQEQVGNMTRYLDFKGHLPIHPTKVYKSMDDSFIQEANLFRTIYNDLPTYTYLQQFQLTSVLMVITPSEDLHQRMHKVMESPEYHDFDMELVNHLYELVDVVKRQKERKTDALDDIPDLLILPHQRYAMLTGELNMNLHHQNFLADLIDLPFVGRSEFRIEEGSRAYYDFEDHVNQVDQWYRNVKYAHFSDHPIPKPWIYLYPQYEIMSERRRCPPFIEDKEGMGPDVIRPAYQATDCHAGEIWDSERALFARKREHICGLELVRLDGDPKKDQH